MPEELDEINNVFEKVKSVKADEIRITALEHFERLIEDTSIVKEAHNVKNSAVALEIILSVFENHLEDLHEGWINDTKNRNGIPISTIFGQDTVPADTAKKIKRFVDKMVDSGKIQSKEKWRALEILCNE